MIVDEGYEVRLECSATGQPRPLYTWRSDERKPILFKTRSDVNKAIEFKIRQQSSVNSSILHFKQVSRDHMGHYVCIASNGIPPPAFKKYKLEVAFPPLIKIRNQMVGTVNGSYALLECFVEAHPPAVNFWLHGDNRLVEQTWKYKIDQRDDHYRTHMILNISYIEPLDYGLYKCVSKNDKGKTLGVFTVFEIDPNTPTRKPPVETFEVYGQPPPTPIMEIDCEPCVTRCDPTPFCPTSGSSDLATVLSVAVPNASLYVPPAPRKENCKIHQLGKPVFQRSSKEEIGAWFQDPLPPEGSENKYYAINSSEPMYVYEYANREDFRNHNYSNRYDPPFGFVGTGHLVYNGSFYYQQPKAATILRYEMPRAQHSGKDYEDMVHSGTAYLYSTKLGYIDLMADENGMWVVYSARETNNTLVRKLDPYTLNTEYIWNLTFPHQNVGEMFIACGVLYGVTSVTEPTTNIKFAFDLYQNKVLEANIAFSNPFRNNSMIAYNPRYRKIYTWDKGNQLLYPILFRTIDLGQPEEKDEPR
ncbi:Noelin, partial [Stegodyphus mimosarum]